MMLISGREVERVPQAQGEIKAMFLFHGSEGTRWR
jgi:hypothetical protein